jgi:predicted anti-sigma-YlaC factor YlaD
MANLMNTLMLSCKRATELIEKKQVVGLTVVESVRLKMHLSMCSACKSYENQSQAMDKLLGVFTSKKTNEEGLSETRKAMILEELKKVNEEENKN